MSSYSTSSAPYWKLRVRNENGSVVEALRTRGNKSIYRSVVVGRFGAEPRFEPEPTNRTASSGSGSSKSTSRTELSVRSSGGWS